jgi:hypothetical protein
VLNISDRQRVIARKVGIVLYATLAGISTIVVLAPSLPFLYLLVDLLIHRVTGWYEIRTETGWEGFEIMMYCFPVAVIGGAIVGWRVARSRLRKLADENSKPAA